MSQSLVGVQLVLELQHLCPGVAQEDHAAEAGLSRASFHRLKAGVKVSRQTLRLFATYVANKRPNIWSQVPLLADLRAEYEAKENEDKKSFKRWLDTVEPLLLQIRYLSESPSLEAVFSLWLLGWIAQDRAKVFAEDPGTNYELAIARFERAAGLLQEVGPPKVKEYDLLLDRLRFARFGAYFLSLDENTRSADPAVIKWLQESNMLENLKRLGKAAPYDWGIQRNGLVVASILKDATACEHFHSALLDANREFAQMDFRPNAGKRSSLRDDPDLGYFRETFGSSTARVSALPSGARPSII